MGHFEDKAKKFVDELVFDDGLDVGAMMHRKIEERLCKLLKEQDRDTRHKCADIVLAAKDIDDAHNLCMNVRFD